ncbi:MAG: bifunctional 5,10-methylenetetrahydrofolate dehydrogenase/5,10-methenyltetrahydrofolate cyclohydrolase [Syntrophomonadaceae bacterium]|jgi:methylenetetrahydrofolate dehydrogenase (NADP+)/methenyltetrahydrofolate cyclohydrolase
MEIISGSVIAEEIKIRLSEANQLAGLCPVLAPIVVGNNPESIQYVSLKEKAVFSIGGKTQRIILPPDTSREALLKIIEDLNEDSSIHGILLQLPLPEGIALYEHEFLAAISPEKDVDGFHPFNKGNITSPHPGFISCAVLGCLEVINRFARDLDNKQAVLVGNSFDLIIPLSEILIKKGLRVLVVPEYSPMDTREGDILVIEKGSPGIVKSDGIKDGALVLDAGFHWKDGKTCGNVDRDAVQERKGHLLPVPGGLGPLLIAKLMENLTQAARRNN